MPSGSSSRITAGRNCNAGEVDPEGAQRDPPLAKSPDGIADLDW
jgi:hypothetical protein